MFLEFDGYSPGADATKHPREASVPVEYVFPDREWDVRVHIRGAIRESELIEILEQLFVHPEYHADSSWFVECEDVSLEHFGLGPVRRMAKFTAQHEPELRAAVVAVAAPQLAVFGVSRMFQLLHQPPHRMAVFRSSAAARSWLAENAPRPKRG